jgi:hypothetical protein
MIVQCSLDPTQYESTISVVQFASEFVSNANLNNLRIVNKKNENIKFIDNLRKKVFIILKN